MKNKDPSQKKKPFTVFKMLGYIFGTTFLVTFLVIKGISFSSYKKTCELQDAATVAKPILNLNFPNGYETVAVVNSSSTIQFTVSNKENGKISETALQYKISIEKNSELPQNSMYFWLSETDENGKTLPAGVGVAGAGSDSAVSYSKKQLPAGKFECHYYKLEYRTSVESLGQTLFNISVDVEQVI